MAIITYAQNFEDILLNRVFKGKKEGFYIDAGAAHPEILSVTKWFYDLGWRGINIEPTPSFFEKLTQERQRDINLNIAVGAKNEMRTFYESDFQEASSFICENTESANLIVSNILNNKRKSYDIEVQTIENICEKYCNCPIDFLKIDVEGFEREVLEGCNFTKFRPVVIVIEAIPPFSGIDLSSPFDGEDIASLNKTETLKWEQILINNNYKKVYFDGINCFYIRNEDIYLEIYFSTPVNPYEFIFPEYNTEKYDKETDVLPTVFQKHIYNLQTSRNNEKKIKLTLEANKIIEKKASDEKLINEMQIIEIKDLKTKIESNSKTIQILEDIILSNNSEYLTLKTNFEEIFSRYQNSQLLNLSYREEIYNLKYPFTKRFFFPNFLLKKHQEKLLDFSSIEEGSLHSDIIKTNIESNEIFRQDILINKIISLLAGKNISAKPIKYIAGIEHIQESIDKLVDVPWCGSIVTPIHLPDWYKNDVTNYKNFFSSSKIKEALKSCIFFISYSNTITSDISQITSIPIFTHLHPLPTSNKKWSPEAYKESKNKKIIQIGNEMRCLHAIYMLPQSSFKKILLSTCDQQHLKSQLLREKKNIGNEYRLSMLKTAEEFFDKQGNIEKWYDGNIFFLHLFDTSVDWVVLKCIADNVPLLINRLPSIIEYLGDEYPLFYSCYDEAIEKATDLDLILQTHEYLKSRSAEPYFTLNEFIEKISKYLSTK